MRHLAHRRPSAAMVVAVIALVVAASGTAVAATNLTNGDSLIKKNSLSGNRLRNGSVPGTKIKIGSLGTVPSASHASTADTATNATNATNAANASSAAIAKVTNVATTASIDSTNAPSGVAVTASCPAGTVVVGGGASVSSTQNDFVDASAPAGHSGWIAVFFGAPGDTGTVTAICAPAAASAP
jgi:hypothetical protein